MAQYLLDSDTCSYVMKRSHPASLQRIRNVPLVDQAVSVVTVAELLYGVKLSASPKKTRAAFDAFIRHLAIRERTVDAAENYADIRARLRRQGQPIGASDLMIAAHARGLNAVLVTNNVRELARVRGLEVENWAT